MGASLMGHLDIVRLLLGHNALIEQQPPNGERALSLAAYKGHIDVCRLLVKRDAKPSPADQPELWRPLACADRNNHHEIAAYLRAVIAAGSYGAYVDRTYNDLYVLRLLEHEGRATIRDAGTPENPLDDKLVYAMKCFVAMEGGTEKTLLKNIFEWWCSDPMEMEVYEPTEDDLRREVENGTSDVSEGSSGDDEE